ncbi:hypothetical protein GS597_09665 [Synechococcales cyanobacterium C]|uniref:Uncharacterized protein n=1 Tax=Petrachloros mirabilis ULC683 TaxID=2781853 RepID=A0A8K2A8A2_9CYAN|nr:hypothetical protein [Petrachloros mirabilis]NCJ06770.1 hypothetical protein [Petrachloros mirabilis ULC683]
MSHSRGRTSLVLPPLLARNAQLQRSEARATRTNEFTTHCMPTGLPQQEATPVEAT